jgi:hypothetical protein
VDIDAHAIKRGNKKTFGSDNIELIHGAFETFSSPVEPDVITLFHVLEHLSNPLEVLSHLRSISHDDTKLIVEVPILEYGKTNDINGFLSVQHMTHFSMHSLAQLMNRAGWNILERQQMPDYNGHRILAQRGVPTDIILGDVSDRVKVTEYFEHWFRQLSEVSKKIESWPKTSKIVVWGAGMHSEFLYQVTQLFHQNIHCEFVVVDSDPLKWRKSWRGLQIYSPEILDGMVWDDSVLIISSYGGQESIAKAALKLNVPDNVIKRLYDFVRVY